MKEQPYLQSIWKNLGAWTVPLLSVTSFVPLVLFYSSSPSEPPQSRPNLPPPSQLSPSLITSNTAGTMVASPRPKVLSEQKPTRPAEKKAEPAELQPQPKAKPPQKTVTRVSSPQINHPLPPAPANYQPPQLEIRVAIEREANSISLGTSTTGVVTDRNGTPLKTLGANQGVWITPVGESLSMDGVNLPAVVFVEPSGGGLIYVKDRWYRGRMLLVSQGNTILAVNYLDLEKYLYSVVGSEMHHNAPTEALKAQAIAARSYALVHMIRPASSWFNLGNTQRWQVYKGLQSESNTTHHAVNETAGQILSYKGGVVESLYAATDEIVARAHGGRGMSQTGAYELAKVGYDYEQILANYYPGVGLARLILQAN